MAQHASSSPPPRQRRSSGPGLAELVEFFLDHLAAGGASANTLAAYRRDLVGVAGRMPAAQGLDDVSRLRLPQVDSAALDAAMAAWATDHAPASVARAWAAWSSFFTYLISEGIARANPTEAAQRPKPPAPAPRAIAGGDVSERLLSAAAVPEPSSPSAVADTISCSSPSSWATGAWRRHAAMPSQRSGSRARDQQPPHGPVTHIRPVK